MGARSITCVLRPFDRSERSSVAGGVSINFTHLTECQYRRFKEEDLTTE